MTHKAVGLIGGIATGKSLALAYFNKLGIETIDADHIARQIVSKDSPLLATIVEYFGPAILTHEGELNRKHLRDIIFREPQHRLYLENLLHPIIRQRIDAAIDHATDPYCVVAIPLLKRREDYPKLTTILMLDVPRKTQLARLLARDHVSMAQAKDMIASQPTRQERLDLADVVLQNNKDEATLFAKIKAFDKKLRSA